MESCKKCESALPFSALRFVRSYQPRFRKLVVKFLQTKQANKSDLRIEDVQECIAMAYEVFTDDVGGQVAIPELDQDMTLAAIRDYRNGRYQTIQEILDELP